MATYTATFNLPVSTFADLIQMVASTSNSVSVENIYISQDGIPGNLPQGIGIYKINGPLTGGGGTPLTITNQLPGDSPSSVQYLTGLSPTSASGTTTLLWRSDNWDIASGYKFSPRKNDRLVISPGQGIAVRPLSNPPFSSGNYLTADPWTQDYSQAYGSGVASLFTQYSTNISVSITWSESGGYPQGSNVLVPTYGTCSAGAQIPPLSQIVDSSLNVWTVQNGVIYINGGLAGFSASVILLVYYQNRIYQENIVGNWYYWYPQTSSWIGPQGSPLPQPLLTAGTSLLWGACGHFDQGGPYVSISVQQQINDLQAIFGTAPNTVLYRGFNSATQASLVTQFQSAGIIPICILAQSPIWSSFVNEAAAYNAAYTAAQAFVSACSMVQLWEIGDKWDTTTSPGYLGDGSTAADWNTIPYFPVIRGTVAGTIAAVRDFTCVATQVFVGASSGGSTFGLALALATGLSSYTTPSGTVRNLMFDFCSAQNYNDSAGTGTIQGLPSNLTGGYDDFSNLYATGKYIGFTAIGSSDHNNSGNDASAGVEYAAIINNIIQNKVGNGTSTIGAVLGCMYQLYQQPGTQTDYFLYNYTSGTTNSGISAQGTVVKNALAPTTAAKILQANNVYFGANGHWNGQDGSTIYSTRTDAQVIADLQNVFGSSPHTITYRAWDLDTTASNIATPAQLANAISPYINAGIIPIIIIYDGTMRSTNLIPGIFASESAAYTSVYNQVSTWIQAINAVNPGATVMWEMSNEVLNSTPPSQLEVQSNVNGQQGNLPSNFTGASVTAYPVVRGMHAAAKKAILDNAPQHYLLGGCSGNWSEYGLPIQLQSDLAAYQIPGGAITNLKFDLTTFHFYNDIQTNGTALNQEVTLSNSSFNGGTNYYSAMNACGVPFAITEYGSGDQNGKYESAAASAIQLIIQDMYTNRAPTSTLCGIAVACIYELYRDTQSLNYGLYESNFTLTQTGTAVKNFINTNGNGPPSTTKIPYFVGVKLGFNLNSAVSAVETWFGRKIDGIGQTVLITTQFISSGNFPGLNNTLPFVNFQFPLLSNWNGGDSSSAYEDLAAAAAGSYNSQYQLMANAMKNFGNPTTFAVRIGWEMNASGHYPWQIGGPGGVNQSYANYIGAFRQAAQIIKATIPNVLIEFCANYGSNAADPFWPGLYNASTNPGGADVVSVDFYQANVTQYYTGGVQATWAQTLTGNNGAVPGIQYYQNFAQAQGAKFAWAEWGAGSPSSKGAYSGAGLNDGAWTTGAIAYINSLPAGFFLWTLWGNDPPADDIVTAGANPAEQAAWINAWQKTIFGGTGSTWWKGALPPSQ